MDAKTNTHVRLGLKAPNAATIPKLSASAARPRMRLARPRARALATLARPSTRRAAPASPPASLPRPARASHRSARARLTAARPRRHALARALPPRLLLPHAPASPRLAPAAARSRLASRSRPLARPPLPAPPTTSRGVPAPCPRPPRPELGRAPPAARPAPPRAPAYSRPRLARARAGSRAASPCARRTPAPACTGMGARRRFNQLMYVPNHSFSSPAPCATSHCCSTDSQRTALLLAGTNLILVIAMLFLIFLQRSS
nr:translation initiation factor IF-2-like [Aegilops tauschii subsp. strangulata]